MSAPVMAHEKTIVRLPSLTKIAVSRSPSSMKSPISQSKENLIKVPQGSLQYYIDVKEIKNDTMENSASSCSDRWPASKPTKNTAPFSEEIDRRYKPKLLEQLETFLQKELFLLGVTDTECNELTLQAHQEVFEYLIDNFKTYKPLLSRIKNSYELTLNSLRLKLNNLASLKPLVVTTAEKYEQKIMAIYEKEKQELVELFEENHRLISKIHSLLKEQEYTECVLGMMEQEQEDLYSSYRSEIDNRKQLVTEMNNLRLQHQTNQRQKKEGQKDIQEDPVALREAVRQAREEEKISSQRLNEIIADYCDVIPGQDFDTLKKKYEESSADHGELMNTFQTLKAEHSTLLDKNKMLTQERNDYYQECEELRRTSVAIDHWDKCIDYINGEETRWEEVSSEKVCKELLEILLQTSSSKESSILAADIISFQGKGLGSDIPKLLRYEGDVRNRRMGQRDCALMIKDIWSTRTYDDKKECNNFTDFVDDYMKQKFPDTNLKVEWAYALYDTSMRLASSNHYIGLFWKILNEEVDESVYHSQQILTKHLYEFLHQAQKEETGPIKKMKFQEHLQEFLTPAKPEVISSLVETAAAELNTEDIEYEQLMVENGEVGPFLKSLRDWLESAKMDFIEDIAQKTSDSRLVRVEDLENLLRIPTDYKLEPISMNKLQCWCFKTTNKELATAQPTTLEEILSRLKQVGFTYKHSTHKQ